MSIGHSEARTFCTFTPGQAVQGYVFLNSEWNTEYLHMAVGRAVSLVKTEEAFPVPLVYQPSLYVKKIDI